MSYSHTAKCQVRFARNLDGSKKELGIATTDNEASTHVRRYDNEI